MGDETPLPNATEGEKERAGADLRKALDDGAWDIVMKIEELVEQRVHQLLRVDVDRLIIDRKAKTNTGYAALRNRLREIVKRTGAGRFALQYHLRALRSQRRAKMVGNRATARWLAA